MKSEATMPPERDGGFSLVEVALATGLFAFVVVGIIGMFPVGMKQQAISSQENLGMAATRQIMASLAAATNADAVSMLSAGGSNKVVTTLTSQPLVLGYQAGSMIPDREFTADSESVWQNGSSENIQILVRLALERRPDELYLVRVEASGPAAAPLTNRRVTTFTTLLSFDE